jgi:hypothetical protein
MLARTDTAEDIPQLRAIVNSEEICCKNRVRYVIGISFSPEKSISDALLSFSITEVCLKAYRTASTVPTTQSIVFATASPLAVEIAFQIPRPIVRQVTSRRYPVIFRRRLGRI